MRQLYEDDKEYLYLTFNINIFNSLKILDILSILIIIFKRLSVKTYIYKIYKKETIF